MSYSFMYMTVISLHIYVIYVYICDIYIYTHIFTCYILNG